MNNLGTYIYALGGLEEIGKNTYVIETQKSIVVVDAGIKFANSTLLGFDALIANYEHLKQNEDKIEALIITHGHEDHIGGIPYLLREVKIKKIIASKLTTQLIIKRLSEFKDITLPEIIVYSDDDTFELGDIKVEFYRVCHSIPDSFGLAFETNDGRIVSTGDFRFDFATESDNTDLAKLMQISSKGVDVLLCESTSAEVPGFSESEKYIIKNIEDIIRNAKGRVFMSTFASNLSRIEQILLYVKTLNKKILILGRSMDNNIKISRKLGYLSISDLEFIQSKEIANYADNEIFVVLTGSQGEENAALNAICNNRHSKITFKPSDTIILSSNPIPGNFAQVEEMINKLYKLGVTVYENKPDKKIHASGHATRSELQLMIKAINPTYLFPIHGEYKMLRMLKQNAMDLDIDESRIIIAVNGQKLLLKNHKLELTNEIVNTDPIYINGNKLSVCADELLKTRHVLSNEGFIYLLIKYDLDKKNIASVSFSTRGCFFAKDSKAFVIKINSYVKEQLNIIAQKDFDFDKLKQEAIAIAKDFIWKFKRKNPIIEVDFLDLNIYNNMIKNQDYLKLTFDSETTIEEELIDDFNEEVL